MLKKIQFEFEIETKAVLTFVELKIDLFRILIFCLLTRPVPVWNVSFPKTETNQKNPEV